MANIASMSFFSNFLIHIGTQKTEVCYSKQAHLTLFKNTIYSIWPGIFRNTQTIRIPNTHLEIKKNNLCEGNEKQKLEQECEKVKTTI